MDKFCKSTFWDNDLTWYTDNPDFTDCFKNTVLVWIPCSYLWISLPLEIYYLQRSIQHRIDFSTYNVLKLTAIFLIAAASVLDVISNISYYYSSSWADVTSPIIKSLTFILFFLLTYANMRMGVRSSGILFTFSLLLVVCGLPQLRSLIIEFIRTYKSGKNRPDNLRYLPYYISVILIFILNCFADSKPKFEFYDEDETKNPKGKGKSFLSRMYLCWLSGYVWSVHKNPVTKCIWEVPPEDKASYVLSKFEKYQNPKQGDQPLDNDSNKAYIEFKKMPFDDSAKTRRSFVKPLLKMYRLELLQAMGLRAIEAGLFICYPIIFNLLITQLNNGEPIWKAYMLGALFFVNPCVQAIAVHIHLKIITEIQLGVRNVLLSLIYKKALTISNETKKEYTTGDINTLLSVDIDRILALVAYVNYAWIAVVQLGSAFYFIWNILGASTAAGLIITVLFIPANHFLAKYTKTLQKSEMEHKDRRSKFIQETLAGIKVLKMYAWEDSFKNEALQQRKNEVKALKKSIYLAALVLFLFTSFPFLVPMVIFATYILSDPTNILDVQKAFVSISFVNSFRNSLQHIPSLFTSAVQANVSIKRINNFLNAEELDPGAVSHDNTDEVLVIKNGYFSWSGYDGRAILNNINIKIDDRKLVAIVGSVGAGKTSLISAFLGEMYRLSGYVNSKGRIAYVPQQAWILNATLKENITLGEPLDQVLYEKVLSACGLIPDLKEMPDGDSTEIGENGINLSGGQKQRVSLARAVYQNKDVYLLDDPLSAVDFHVANFIFNNVFGPNGILKDKTRVLVTHGIKFLPQVDYIFVLKNGYVTENGTYDELLSTEGDFSEFLKSYTKEEEITEIPQATQTNINELTKRNTDNKPRANIPELDTTQIINRKTAGKKGKCEEGGNVKKLIEAEHLEIKTVNKSVYRFYISAFGSFFAFWTIAMFILYQVLAIMTNIWLAKWTTSTKTVGNQDPNDRYFYLFVYMGLGICQTLSSMLGNFALFIGLLKASTHLYKKLLKNVLRWPMWLFDSTPVGRIINRFTTDIEVLDTFIGPRLAMLMIYGGRLLSVVFVIIYYMPMCAIVMIPAMIAVYIAQRYYIVLSHQLKRIESINKSPLFSYYVQTSAGLSSIRAFNFENKFISRLHEKADAFTAAHYANHICEWWLLIRMAIFNGFTIFFTILFALFERESLGVGMIAFLVSFTMQIMKETTWLVTFLAEVENSLVAVERIKEFIEYPQEAEHSFPSDKKHTEWPTKGEIIFKNYKLKYRKDMELILKGITFETNESEKVGIVGRTGAGKSSLILGLFRIVEAHEGSIIIDEVNISTVGLQLLRSRLTVIPQDPVLFLGTLRFNLDPTGQYTDEAIWNALTKAHLKDYVSSLSGGLDYKVDEAGANFSFGQRQLICLARALLRKTKILILDEATASVDLETDKLIQKTIREEFSDCTILTIAHRINTVQDYDRILVLDAGQVTEFDSPENLKNLTNSRFYKMAKESGIL